MATKITSETVLPILEDNLLVTIDDGDRLSIYEHPIKNNLVKVLGMQKLACVPLYEPQDYVTGTGFDDILSGKQLNQIAALLYMDVDTDKGPAIKTFSVQFKHLFEQLDATNIIINSPYLSLNSCRVAYTLFNTDSDVFDEAPIREENLGDKYYHLYHYKNRNIYYPSRKTVPSGLTSGPHIVFDRLILIQGIINATFDSIYGYEKLQFDTFIEQVKTRLSKMYTLLNQLETIKSRVSFDDPSSILASLLGTVQTNSSIDSYTIIKTVVDNKIYAKKLDVLVKELKIGTLQSTIDSVKTNTFNFVNLGNPDVLSTLTDESSFIMKQGDQILATISKADATRYIRLVIENISAFKSNPMEWVQYPASFTDDHKKLFIVLMYLYLYSLNVMFKQIALVIIDLVQSEITTWHEILSGQVVLLVEDTDAYNLLKSTYNEPLRDLGLIGGAIGIADDYNSNMLARKTAHLKPLETIYNLASEPEDYKERYTKITEYKNTSDCGFFGTEDCLSSISVDNYCVYFPCGFEEITPKFKYIKQTGKMHIVPMLLTPPITVTGRGTIGNLSGALHKSYWNSVKTIMADKDAIDALTGNMEKIIAVVNDLIMGTTSPSYQKESVESKIVELLYLCNTNNETVKIDYRDILQKAIDSITSISRLAFIIPEVLPSLPVNNIETQTKTNLQVTPVTGNTGKTDVTIANGIPISSSPIDQPAQMRIDGQMIDINIVSKDKLVPDIKSEDIQQ